MDFLEAIAKIDDDRRMTEEDLLYRRELLDIIRDNGMLTKKEIKMLKDYERSLAILNFYAAKVRQQEEGTLAKGNKRQYAEEYFEFIISGEWKNYLVWEDESRELEARGIDPFEEL